MEYAVLYMCVCVCVCVRARTRVCVCVRACAHSVMSSVIIQLCLIQFLYIFKIIYVIGVHVQAPPSEKL
jgi:hypothetical protein